ncbi:MAG: hypothetical protein ACE5E9_12025 [Nitrospinaceae bacterium]
MMDISIVPINKITKVYQRQDRIAELNKKSDIKSVQGQVDRVTLSAAGRSMETPAPVNQNPIPQPAPSPGPTDAVPYGPVPQAGTPDAG